MTPRSKLDLETAQVLIVDMRKPNPLEISPSQQLQAASFTSRAELLLFCFLLFLLEGVFLAEVPPLKTILESVVEEIPFYLAALLGLSKRALQIPPGSTKPLQVDINLGNAWKGV
jgi:hypothetical protein